MLSGSGESSLGFHEALSHGVSNNAAHNTSQAVLPKLHHEAEQTLLDGVRELPSCVGLKDSLWCPGNQLLEPCRTLYAKGLAKSLKSDACLELLVQGKP